MNFSELLPILKQDREFLANLTANYSLPDSAYAEAGLSVSRIARGKPTLFRDA